MEGKGDSSLTQTKPDALPANGRPIGKATKLIGLGVAAAAVVSGCSLPAWLVGENSNPSSMPSGIVEPSPTGGMPSASTPIEVTPLPSPSTSPSVGPSQTPEVTPTLSPEQQLKQEIADYSSGKIKLPKDGRFYLFLLPGQLPVLANVLAFNGVVNTDFTQPVDQVGFEGYPFNQAVVKASNGKNYLIYYMVQESVKDKNGNSEQYILPVNLGCVDANSTDKDSLSRQAGVVASEGGNLETETIYSAFDLQTQLDNYNKKFVLFFLNYINNPLAFAAARNPEDITAQNPIAGDIIKYSKQTLKDSFSKVPQNKLVTNTINKFVQDGFSINDIPMVMQIRTQ